MVILRVRGIGDSRSHTPGRLVGREFQSSQRVFDAQTVHHGLGRPHPFGAPL